MAATCDKHASNVEAAATTPPAMGATMQATVAAVGAFHAVTTMTGTVLGARLVGTSVAAEYAAWLGKVLPTEQQWEKAARGSDGRLFPWGNEWDGDRVNSAESGRRFLTPVDAFPNGASPYGCLNMAGNVWEWTVTPWEPGSPLMAKKGGCALNFEPHMQCSARFEDPPEMRLRWAGFRLTRVLPEGIFFRLVEVALFLFSLKLLWDGIATWGA